MSSATRRKSAGPAPTAPRGPAKLELEALLAKLQELAEKKPEKAAIILARWIAQTPPQTGRRNKAA